MSFIIYFTLLFCLRRVRVRMYAVLRDETLLTIDIPRVLARVVVCYGREFFFNCYYLWVPVLYI